MTEISLFFGELLFAAIWLIVRAAVYLRQRKLDLRREAQLMLIFVDLAVIIRFCFYPFSRVDGRVQPLIFDPAAAYPFRVNLVPIKHILEFDTVRDLMINIIGNVCMFIPSGIVFPIVYKRLDSFWKTVGAGALVSLCIELLQLPFAVRATDIDDILLNTLGCVIGYSIYALVRAVKNKNRSKKVKEKG